jgi:hypothetical protein
MIIKLNNKLNKKNKFGSVSMNTFFFILMSILMVGIILFGISKLMSLSHEMSKQELNELKNTIKQDLEYCQDSLNKGEIIKIDVNNKEFNGICFLTDNLNSLDYGDLNSVLENIYNSGDNIVFIKISPNDLRNNDFSNVQVIGATNLNGVITEKKSYCVFANKNKEITIKCN